jgi:hypothetical protein
MGQDGAPLHHRTILAHRQSSFKEKITSLDRCTEHF